MLYMTAEASESTATSDVTADVVQVELDGEGVSPDTVDALAMLRVAESYLSLVAKLGQLREMPVTMTGLQIVDKCAAVQTAPTDMQRAVHFCQQATRVVTGQEPAPRGADKAAEAVREALRALPKNIRARVIAGRYAEAIVAPLHQEEIRERAWEQVEIRATLVRAGGRKPVAQFLSLDDEVLFTLDLANEEKARELGRHLYKEVDVEALIVRGLEGGIERGELLDLHVLSDSEPAEAWREWFRVNASEWTEVDDVLGELGRDDD
jgi:hypothetical protein